jgi:sugar (pentulose or hexulose) kinase
MLLGIDLGTSYFKALLVSPDGRVLGLGRVPLYPVERGPGFQELPLGEFFAAVGGAVNQALQAAGLKAAEIRAVSYSSQTNSFLLEDRSGTPLTPVILWSDKRVKTVEEPLEAIFEHPGFRAVTGLGLKTNGFCMSKADWIKRNEPEIWGKTARLYTLADYLTYRLTGERQGDAGTAALLGFWNTRDMRWWDFALEQLGLDPSMLSRLHLPGSPAGSCAGPLAADLGIPASAAFALGSLDHHAAAIGAGIGNLSTMTESTGTVLAAVALTKGFSPEKNSATGPHIDPGEYYKVAFNNNGAACLEWYNKNYAPELDLEELNRRAALVPPGADGLRAAVMPHTQPALSGFSGGGSCGHGHYARAMMEGVASSLAQLINIASEGRPPQRIVAAGGGAKSDLWLQIKADISGLSFLRNSSGEPGAYGAAMFAAAAAGYYNSVSEVSRSWVTPGREFAPDPDRHALYRGLPM